LNTAYIIDEDLAYAESLSVFTKHLWCWISSKFSKGNWVKKLHIRR